MSAMGCGAALTMSCTFAEQVPGTQLEAAARPAQPSKPAPANLLQLAPGAIPAIPASSAIPAAPVMRDTGARIALSQFRFSGNAAQPSPTLAALLTAYVGRVLTLAELNEAADVVQRHYRAHGWFLAQAYVPAQLPANGVVEIAVLEGRIDTLTVNVAPDAPIRADYARQLIAAALHPGQTLTESAVEGPLLLLRDLPRVDARSVINPGTVPGSASITLNLARDPDAAIINGRVELDNYGSRASGTNRLGAELNVNNPYGFGDALSLKGVVASEHGNRFGRADYSVPVGAGGARIGASVARLDYVLGQAFDSIKPNGIANVYAARASYPLLRGRNRNLQAQLLLERKELEDRTTAPFSSDRQRLTSGTFRLSGDARDADGSVTQVGVSATSGTLRENDPLRLINDALTYRAEGRFAKYGVSVQRQQQLAPGLHAMLSASGQRANKNLTSAEKYALGGDSTVRAYPLGVLVGDHGYSATAELRWAPAALQRARFNLAAIVFYDIGQVTRNHDNGNAQVAVAANTARISAVGTGVQLGYGAHLLFKVAVAWQAKKLPTSDPAAAAAGRGARAWAQLGYAF